MPPPHDDVTNTNIHPKDNYLAEPDLKAAMQQDAVVVKSAYKRYEKKQPPVLDNLNMTVPRGCIYGLLGASGCGKTTLLSCIVGVHKLDDGEIWVLGGKPGQKGSGVPGSRVGYMPQEISLVGEFSVIGALYYFGRINGLEDKEIDERYPFFSELLQLPPMDRLVKNCSGGQQRRVSFAASLIHNPELLILDEPTVGLDPILRENIWKFLVKLTKEEGTTVIITTHYIEETKLADRIGLLRCGQLLAETTPTALLARFDCEGLEEAFLILSQRQEEHRDREMVDTSNDRPTINAPDELSTRTTPTLQTEHLNKIDYEKKYKKQRLGSQYTKIFRALMIKNFLQFSRHPGIIALALILPITQSFIFFYAIGGDPRGIVMAVVNDEAGDCNYGQNVGKVIYEPDDGICDYIDISCRFLHGFNESLMTKHYFSTLEEATEAVQSGKASGTMYFAGNFSQALQNRRDLLSMVKEGDIAASQIRMALDMGDMQIGLFLQTNLYYRFFDIHTEMLSNCNISKKYAAVPINFEEPVFGSLDQKYSDFMAPGFILALIFFLATSVSSSIIIADRAEGVWDRSLVQGVTTSTILFCHILTQLVLIIMQVTVVLIITFAHFELSCRGDFTMVIVLVLLTGIGGMCYGFLISVMCSSYTGSTFVAIGTFYTLILLGGVMWPMEGMPQFLRYVGYSTPTTIPSLALRGLMDKGSSVFEPEVYSGYLVTIGWTSIFVALCLFGLRKSS